jgi:hypothetical protein
MRRPATLLAVLVLAACSGASGLDGEWVLIGGTLDGVDIVPPPPDPGDMVSGEIRPAHLEIHGGELSGRGPCNLYSGSMEVTERRRTSDGWEYAVAPRDIWANLAGCFLAKAEAVETAYLEAVTGVQGAIREGHTLTLAGDDVVLVFELEHDPT